MLSVFAQIIFWTILAFVGATMLGWPVIATVIGFGLLLVIVVAPIVLLGGWLVERSLARTGLRRAQP
jgi:hypothetical protein